MYTLDTIYPELATLIPQYRADNAWAVRWFDPANADNILKGKPYGATGLRGLPAFVVS